MPALDDAFNAVKYVREQLQVRSTNRVSDKPDQEKINRLNELKAQAEEELIADEQYGGTAALAKATLDVRVGNCDEQAAVAFAYLAERAATARPLELFSVVEGDHAFVVLGRTQGNAGSWKTWNDDAVFCDPWAQLHYQKKDLKSKLSDIAAHCLDKPKDWQDPVTYVDEFGMKRSKGYLWASVKELLTRSSDIDSIRCQQVAELTSGTWTYKLTGSGG